MKWLGLGILATAVILAGLPGYGGAQQAAPKKASTVTQSKGSEAKGGPGQAAKSYSPAEKEAYQKKIATDLEEIQKKVEGLKAKGRTIISQKKHMYLKGMVDIQRKEMSARGKFAALKKASGKEWSRMKEDVDKAMEALTNACNGVESFLK
jgi:hypothetical protein